jgi:hypothetical protein
MKMIRVRKRDHSTKKKMSDKTQCLWLQNLRMLSNIRSMSFSFLDEWSSRSYANISSKFQNNREIWKFWIQLSRRVIVMFLSMTSFYSWFDSVIRISHFFILWNNQRWDEFLQRKWDDVYILILNRIHDS